MNRPKSSAKWDLGTVRDSCHPKKEAEILAVEREMQQVRHDVQARGSAMVASACALTDWRHHAQSHPWVLLGIAAVAGYSLVPRRSRNAQPESGAQDGTTPFVASTAPNIQTGPGFGTVLFRMLRDALLRSGVAFLEREFNRQVDDYASRRRQKDATHDPLST